MTAGDETDPAPGLQSVASVRIELLLVSPRHRYAGRPADGPLPAAGDELPRTVRIRAGLGIVGDRYFAAPAHRRASVTLIGAGALEALSADLGVTVDPVATRRNIVVRGVDVDALRGVRFSLDTGSGPVVFQGNRPANPCAWMDHEIAPGAFRAMRGRGGVRCEPLTDGSLSLGAATFRVVEQPPALPTLPPSPRE